VTLLERARDMVNNWERRHRQPWRIARCPRCAWRFPDWPYTHMEAASLALDGYPARWPSRPPRPRRGRP